MSKSDHGRHQWEAEELLSSNMWVSTQSWTSAKLEGSRLPRFNALVQQQQRELHLHLPSAIDAIGTRDDTAPRVCHQKVVAGNQRRSHTALHGEWKLELIEAPGCWRCTCREPPVIPGVPASLRLSAQSAGRVYSSLTPAQTVNTLSTGGVCIGLNDIYLERWY